MIGKQLAEIYADQFPGEGHLLAGKTIEAVKAAYLSGEAAAGDTWQLALGWEKLIKDNIDNYEVPGSAEMYSAMITFHSLAAELAGETPPRTAVEQVFNAAELPDPRVPAPAGPPQLIQIVPSTEEADESSPAVQLMRKYEEVARLAARQHNTGRLVDPDQLYSIVFG